MAGGRIHLELDMYSNNCAFTVHHDPLLPMWSGVEADGGLGCSQSAPHLPGYSSGVTSECGDAAPPPCAATASLEPPKVTAGSACRSCTGRLTLWSTQACTSFERSFSQMSRSANGASTFPLLLRPSMSHELTPTPELTLNRSVFGFSFSLF